MSDDNNQSTRLDSVVSGLELISATASFIAVILPLIVEFLAAKGLLEE